MPNFSALEVLLPDLNIGLFFSMTILNYESLYDMTSFVLDTILGHEPYRTTNSTCAAFMSQEPDVMFDVPSGLPARVLSEYAGSFGNDAAGQATVAIENGTLYLQYGNIIGRFELISTVIPDVFKGKPTALETATITGVIPIVYTGYSPANPVDMLTIAGEVTFYRDKPLADASVPLPPLCPKRTCYKAFNCKVTQTGCRQKSRKQRQLAGNTAGNCTET